MSVKNFKIGTGLDLEGLILTTANSELLVNGSALATQTYVDNAVSGIIFDGSTAAGDYIDWANSQFNVNAMELSGVFVQDLGFITSNNFTTAIDNNINQIVQSIGSAGAVTLNNLDTTIMSGSNYLQTVAGYGYGAAPHIDVNVSALETRLTDDGFATTSYVMTQLLDYTETSGLDSVIDSYGYLKSADLSGYATESYVTSYITNGGYITSSALSGYALSTDIPSLSGYATESYVTSQGYITAMDVPSDFISSVDETAFTVMSGTLYLDVNNLTTDSSYIQAGYGYGVGSGHSYFDVNITALESRLTDDGFASTTYVDTAISNLVGLAPTTLDTLQELAAAFDNSPDTLTNLVTTVGGKQDALTASTGINLSGSTISVDLAGIAGTGITVTDNKLTAAPGYISSVDASFAVTDGELSLSDTITIASVELTDSVISVTAASDVFGGTNNSGDGTNAIVGTLPTGTEVADVFMTITATIAGTTVSRTSKLTAVFTGSDAPTWTEYGIIASGWTSPVTVSFDSSKHILVNVDGPNYNVKGVVTILK